jgi:hypothetical protein
MNINGNARSRVNGGYAGVAFVNRFAVAARWGANFSADSVCA